MDLSLFNLIGQSGRVAIYYNKELNSSPIVQLINGKGKKFSAIIDSAIENCAIETLELTNQEYDFLIDFECKYTKT